MMSDAERKKIMYARLKEAIASNQLLKDLQTAVLDLNERLERIEREIEIIAVTQVR